MLRSKASTYAILAVVEIAKREQEGAGGVQAGEIARHLNLPAAYMAKVMTRLARAGILRSDRGPRGGFRLAHPAEELNLLEIVEAVDRLFETDARSLDGVEVRRTLENVNRVFERAADQVRTLLRQETIADFVSRSDTVTPGSARADVAVTA